MPAACRPLVDGATVTSSTTMATSYAIAVAGRVATVPPLRDDRPSDRSLQLFARDMAVGRGHPGGRFQHRGTRHPAIVGEWAVANVTG